MVGFPTQTQHPAILRAASAQIRQDGGRTCAIVYNGEIYNTDELLPPLLAAGYTFSTTSDTEVILCAYLHYGRDFVRRLNGFCLCDLGRQNRRTAFVP